MPHCAATNYTAADQDASIRAFRDEVVTAIGTKNLVDVRSPDEFADRILAPGYLAAGAGTARRSRAGREEHRWSKPAEEDGTLKFDDALTALYSLRRQHLRWTASELDVQSTVARRSPVNDDSAG